MKNDVYCKNQPLTLYWHSQYLNHIFGAILVKSDRNGKLQTVRYDAVNAMLLNEFLKEHKAFVEEQRKVQEQGATIVELRSALAQQQKDFQATAAHQQKQIEALTAVCRKSAHSLKWAKLHRKRF
jgi:molybdenum-dependent DNA-binding transcriptional regulator ModE